MLNNESKRKDTVTEKCQKTGRQANFELLRLVAMLFVVMLHYLSKGQILPDFSGKMPTGNQYMAYLFESFAIVAVNAFLLVTGYFMIHAEFHCEKVLALIAQVLFYTVLVPIVLIACHVMPISQFNLYSIINEIIPIQTEHYWFATYYIFLYLCSPFLNRGLHHMNQRQHQYVIAFLLIAFSIMKSIVPVPLATDHKGYDLVWFICVYVIAAYIRLYGISFFNSMKRSVTAYIGLVFAIFLYSVGMGAFCFYTGKLTDQIGEALHYNHILNIMAAVSFFYIFYYMEIKGEKIKKVICSLSPYALGVYLLHEQIDVRYLWPVWCKVKETGETGWFIPHMIGTVIAIFLLGLCVDYFRSGIFSFFKKKVGHEKISAILRKIDQELAEN